MKLKQNKIKQKKRREIDGKQQRMKGKERKEMEGAQ